MSVSSAAAEISLLDVLFGAFEIIAELGAAAGFDGGGDGLLGQIVKLLGLLLIDRALLEFFLVVG